ncbi:hypothetical protein [Mesorhizobium sp. A623]
MQMNGRPLFLLAILSLASAYTGVAIAQTSHPALPEDAPLPSSRVDGGMQGDVEAPTNDLWEAGRRAVREGLKRAAKDRARENDEAIQDPELEKLRQNYLKGYSGEPDGMMRQVIDKIDPDRKLPVSERNMWAMAEVYKFYTNRGDVARAQESAKLMLQYYQNAARQFPSVAQAALQKDKLNKATKAAVAAYANIPNASDFRVTKGENGIYTVTVTDEQSGEIVSQKIMDPKRYAELAMGYEPGTFEWQILADAKLPSTPQNLMQLIALSVDHAGMLPPAERNMTAMGETYRILADGGKTREAQAAAAEMMQLYKEASARYAPIAKSESAGATIDGTLLAPLQSYLGIHDGHDFKIADAAEGGQLVTFTDSVTGDVQHRTILPPKLVAANAMGFWIETFDENLRQAAGQE